MPMKIATLLSHVLWITALQAQEQPAALLLDKLISSPGSYSQVCGFLSAEADIPYRAFELTDFLGARFSKANQSLIDQNRRPLIQAIRARLLDVDFTREAKFPVEDLEPEQNFHGAAYGCDPKSLNPLLLGLIQQLNAIETLPELLIAEQKLVKGIAQAKNDPISPAPFVAGWFVGFTIDRNEKLSKIGQEKRSNLFQAESPSATSSC